MTDSFDSLMPNEGSYFLPSEPQEQKVERQKANSKALAAVPQLKDLVAKLQADIDLFSSVDSINVDTQSIPEEFMQAWHVQQELKKYATEQKEYIEQMIPENLR